MAGTSNGLLRNLPSDPWLRLRQWKERLRTSLWLAPTIGVACALVAAYGVVGIDRHLGEDSAELFEGGPESARELLSTISSSMLTFTALVFSITILALQLASNQFSPRVIRTFLEELVTKLAMATFVGTFVYSVAVLSKVRSGRDAFVPSIATWVALVLVLASVAVFIEYVHRMTHAVRAISVITKIASETHREIERAYGPFGASGSDTHTEATPDSAPDSVIHHQGAAGIVTFVHADRLVKLARDAQTRLELVPRIGDFVPTGGELLRVWGPTPASARCCEAIAFEIERTPRQDPAFGLRQLVDIAVRAVSPGINDPSTAVQALDHLHDLVRQLTRREIEPHIYRDDDGAIRLTVPVLGYAGLVRLAFDEIREYGASSSQVTRRIERALLDCVEVAPPERRAALEEQLALLQPTQLATT